MIVCRDCNNVAERKMAYLAAKQSAIAADTIVALETGASLKSYIPQPMTTMLMSLGPADGVSSLFGWTFGGKVTSFLKSKKLMTDRFTQILNLPTDGSINSGMFAPPNIDELRKKLPARILDSIVPGRSALGNMDIDKALADAEQKPIGAEQRNT